MRTGRGGGTARCPLVDAPLRPRGSVARPAPRGHRMGPGVASRPGALRRCPAASLASQPATGGALPIDMSLACTLGVATARPWWQALGGASCRGAWFLNARRFAAGWSDKIRGGRPLGGVCGSGAEGRRRPLSVQCVGGRRGPFTGSVG